MEGYDMGISSAPSTPTTKLRSSYQPHSREGSIDITPATSSSSALVELPSSPSILLIPKHLTQEIVDADPRLKRLQLDLLILTSFNENETLHWRPHWFKKEPFSKRFWTIQNPPNVITERLPRINRGRDYYTRKMRTSEQSQPFFIKTWDHWRRYCNLYGVPYDFLCEDQINLMRLGLPRDHNGLLCAPPAHPLYPEPQSLNQGRYLLDPSTYVSHLPRKFHKVDHPAAMTDQAEVIVIHSDGALAVETRDQFFMHESQWTHFDGHGGYRLDVPQIVDHTAPKEQGPGRRWSCLPWTKKQEKSCAPMKLNLRSLAKRGKEMNTEVSPFEKVMQSTGMPNL